MPLGHSLQFRFCGLDQFCRTYRSCCFLLGDLCYLFKEFQPYIIILYVSRTCWYVPVLRPVCTKHGKWQFPVPQIRKFANAFHIISVSGSFSSTIYHILFKPDEALNSHSVGLPVFQFNVIGKGYRCNTSGAASITDSLKKKLTICHAAANLKGPWYFSFSLWQLV